MNSRRTDKGLTWFGQMVVEQGFIPCNGNDPLAGDGLASTYAQATDAGPVGTVRYFEPGSAPKSYLSFRKLVSISFRTLGGKAETSRDATEARQRRLRDLLKT